MLRSIPSMSTALACSLTLAQGTAPQAPAAPQPPAAPQAPAVPQPPEAKDTAPAVATAIPFDTDTVGALPADWKVGGTKQVGPLATWQITTDASAPSAPNVLALATINHTSSGTYNLCWTPEPRFSDGTVAVAFKAVSGEEDQGGGPIWRVQDADNYYICRANPLEGNFRVYVVKAGKRSQLATADVEIPAGAWSTIKVEHIGTRITCWLDGKKLLEAEDGAIPAAGGVGVWTKADAATWFDDLAVSAK